MRPAEGVDHRRLRVLAHARAADEVGETWLLHDLLGACCAEDLLHLGDAASDEAFVIVMQAEMDLRNSEL